MKFTEVQVTAHERGTRPKLDIGISASLNTVSLHKLKCEKKNE